MKRTYLDTELELVQRPASEVPLRGKISVTHSAVSRQIRSLQGCLRSSADVGVVLSFPFIGLRGAAESAFNGMRPFHTNQIKVAPGPGWCRGRPKLERSLAACRNWRPDARSKLAAPVICDKSFCAG